MDTTVNSTALKIHTEEGRLTVISAYSSPYNNIMEILQELNSIITDLELYLLNETNSPPKFEHCGRKRWPDLSFIKGTDFANSCTWKVLEDYNNGDHNYILRSPFLEITLPPRFKTAYGGQKRMLHLRQKTKQQVQQIEESNTKDHLVNATEELQNAIIAACRKEYKIRKKKKEKRITSPEKKN
ncbi:hypothetical protein AVEN_255788-1 [Araneus ventricosus]|uniref:Endonuclease/exonuclease/phosphatase domain-containing protein n=1 Tax=Araneus ventricosus TaxID=182803 RepID=A0A4Y2QCV8_ARAVE|nr:hypothetical protein AVEN_255788-1 [Araneus ventricosus]